MTSTDEILAVAVSVMVAATGAGAADQAAEVTEADLAAFRAAAELGAGSDVVRALRTVHPASGRPVSGLLSSASEPGNAPWTAWLTAAAATAAAIEAGGSQQESAVPGNAGGSADTGSPGNTGSTAAPRHPAWLAVFAAATALSGPPEAPPGPVPVPAAVAAGMSAAAVVEAGRADWGGWSPGSVAAAVGASVTAGLLLGLTQPQLRAALGISATQAAGLAAADGTPALALQVGKAAFNGVEAALLARVGLTAPTEPLDGRRGLFALFG